MKLCGNYALQVEILSRIRLKTKYKKKSLHRKLKGFCLINRVKTKKKKEGLHRNLVLFSARIWDLFVLTATFSSDHPDPYSQQRI